MFAYSFFWNISVFGFFFSKKKIDEKIISVNLKMENVIF